MPSFESFLTISMIILIVGIIGVTFLLRGRPWQITVKVIRFIVQYIVGQILDIFTVVITMGAATAFAGAITLAVCLVILWMITLGNPFGPVENWQAGIVGFIFVTVQVYLTLIIFGWLVDPVNNFAQRAMSKTRIIEAPSEAEPSPPSPQQQLPSGQGPTVSTGSLVGAVKSANSSVQAVSRSKSFSRQQFWRGFREFSGCYLLFCFLIGIPVLVQVATQSDLAVSMALVFAAGVVLAILTGPKSLSKSIPAFFKDKTKHKDYVFVLGILGAALLLQYLPSLIPSIIFGIVFVITELIGLLILLIVAIRRLRLKSSAATLKRKSGGNN